MAKAKADPRRSFAASIVALRRSKDNVNIGNVRAGYLKYMLIFPLAPVFANMQGALFSDTVQLFTLDAMTLMGSAYCLGAGVLFAFTNTKNMALLARLTALSTVAAFAVWLFMPESLLSLLLAIVFAFGLGGCAAWKPRSQKTSAALFKGHLRARIVPPARAKRAILVATPLFRGFSHRFPAFDHN